MVIRYSSKQYLLLLNTDHVTSLVNITASGWHHDWFFLANLPYDMQRVPAGSALAHSLLSTEQRRHMRLPRWLARKISPTSATTGATRSYPVFEATPALLDLDAEGATCVRPHDPAVDGKQESHIDTRKRRTLPQATRLARFEKLSFAYASRFNDTCSTTNNLFKISDHDVIYTTLLGLPPDAMDPSQETPSSDMGNLRPVEIQRAVLDHNAIPYFARANISKTTAYMIRRQRVTTLKSSQWSTGNFQGALSGCDSLSDMARLISPTLQSRLGCQLVALSGHAVARQCVQIWDRSDDPSMPARMLAFINDLTSTLQSKRLPLRQGLVRLGLKLSLQCRSLAAAQAYLGCHLNDMQGVKWHATANSILRTLLRMIIEVESDVSLASPDAHVSQRLLPIYGLLTGNIFGGETTEASISHVLSILDSQMNTQIYTKLNSPQEDPRTLYLLCLYRLGALRTMWHSWDRHPQLAQKVKKESINSVSRNLRRKAYTSGVQTSSIVEHITTVPGSSDATGVYSDDCLRDMQGIILLDQSMERQMHQDRNEYSDLRSIFSGDSIRDRARPKDHSNNSHESNNDNSEEASRIRAFLRDVIKGHGKLVVLDDHVATRQGGIEKGGLRGSEMIDLLTAGWGDEQKTPIRPEG